MTEPLLPQQDWGDFSLENWPAVRVQKYGSIPSELVTGFEPRNL